MSAGSRNGAKVGRGGDKADPVPAIEDFAPAKVNLSLEIAGRRPDGYHELVSLVAFATIGDTLTLHPATTREVSLETEGPFAAAIDGDNLVLRATQMFLDTFDTAQGGRFVLTKRLPVAAGIGGGSSDAAAALRLLARSNTRHGVSPPAWEKRLMPALSRLGADIPVCLEARAAWVRGIGESVTPVDGMPELPAVLVNPGIALATREVFAALNAPALGDAASRQPETPGAFANAGALIGFLHDHPNDLEAPAGKLAPITADILDALQASPGCALARLSGSGPTCFGLFGTRDAAIHAAETLRAAHPDWWLVETRLA
ncbi:MAG: 4-(cytidine 5'-diphospho)-2-C-methyl-D-erythritol kinase [Dichotomicrobium sp.]